MASTTLNIKANAAPVLIEAATTLRATGDAYRRIAKSCVREAEKLEARAVGVHEFVYDPESGDCGECAYPVEHPCHPAPEPALHLCRACQYGHFVECEDERCQSTRLEDRHE